VVVGLARSRSLSGPWNDLGPILRARPERGWTDTWIGAGAVPLPLGNGRYLEIYHSGHLAAGGSRLYTLGATVLNFAQLDPARLESIVESRFDHFMRPGDALGDRRPVPRQRGQRAVHLRRDVHGGVIRILYGGGDSYVLAADVSKAELLAALA